MRRPKVSFKRKVAEKLMAQIFMFAGCTMMVYNQKRRAGTPAFQVSFGLTA